MHSFPRSCLPTSSGPAFRNAPNVVWLLRRLKSVNLPPRWLHGIIPAFCSQDGLGERVLFVFLAFWSGYCISAKVSRFMALDNAVFWRFVCMFIGRSAERKWQRQLSLWNRISNTRVIFYLIVTFAQVPTQLFFRRLYNQMMIAISFQNSSFWNRSIENGLKNRPVHTTYITSIWPVQSFVNLWID